MRLNKIIIENYRSIESLEIKFGAYSSFVGANGSGKSSVLYAANWLINGGNLEAADVHSASGDAIVEDEPKVVSVIGEFTDLTERDRERLEKYGRGTSLTIRRSWTIGDPKSKIVGSALQGPNFISVRNAASIVDARKAYANLRKIHSDLPEAERLARKENLDSLLSRWEDQTSNLELLEQVDNDDATNFFGFDGQNRLRQCVRLVLVPAASDIASEVAGTKKGSAINELIGALMTNAGSTAREEWITAHESEINELTESMKRGVDIATGIQATRINERLENLIGGASVSFATNVPSWVPSPVPSVTTDVSLDGIVNDVSKQGHGIQRAVMIAMFQSLTPDGKSAEQSHELLDGESPETADARLQAAKDDLPSLIICIEEPEICQHPIRARSFARVLVNLSQSPKVQVFLATHSPYFVRPSDFESLRRFTLIGGKTQVHQTTFNAVASEVGGAEKLQQVMKVINQQLPTTFSEGFFADVVVLVEGDTDKAVMEELADKVGAPFDAAGISVLDMGGKGNLKIPATMLQNLGIPTYIVADGDALGARRSNPDNAAAEKSAHDSHRAETYRLIAWLPSATNALLGSLPFAFEDATVVCDKFTIWEDDVENELANWPSFVNAQSQNSHSIRQKDMLAYRADVVDADAADIPKSLRTLVEAIHIFRESN